MPGEKVSPKMFPPAVAQALRVMRDGQARTVTAISAHCVDLRESSVRSALNILLDEGLLEASPQEGVGAVGRPPHLYKITPEGLAAYESANAGIARAYAWWHRDSGYPT